MHFFIYLSSLLLLALSIDGLPPSRGWWCGTKPCNAIIEEMEDSRDNNTALNNRAVTKIEATKTAVTSTEVTSPTVYIPVPNSGPQNRPSQWWCGTRPCDARKRETDSRLHHTAVTNTSFTNTSSTNTSLTNTTRNTSLPDNGQAWGTFGWWCGTHPCRSRMKAVKKRQIDITSTSNEDSAAPATLQAIPGWTCGDRICPPKSKVIERGQINDTAVNNTITNTTASNSTGHRRIAPAVIWWCGTHICGPTGMKAVKKREFNLPTSGASESS